MSIITRPPAEAITPATTEHWLALRRADVTSTESAALFGMSPYTTRFEVWHRKRSGQAGEFKSTERMAWGNRFEAAIAAGIAEEQGWIIEPMKDYLRNRAERTGSSFDFRILNHPDGPAHLEIKNVDYFAFKDGWMKDDAGMYEAPEHIEMQVQHQMLVSGYSRAFIGALVGGNRGIVIERLRDEPVIAAIRARIAEFWHSVDTGQEPPPVMPEDAAAVIRMNQYAEPGKILDASGDAKIATLVTEYKAATATKKNAEEDAERLKAELLLAIGDAEKVLLEGFTISAGTRADSPPTVITEDMIGNTYGGRKGFRDLRITAKKVKVAA